MGFSVTTALPIPRTAGGQVIITRTVSTISLRTKYSSKDFHWKHYKNLLQSVGLPDIRWHDLRSTYRTLLLKSDFNPKAILKLMGHAKELVTVDVYGDNSNIIPEEIPELLAYMKDVMPPEGSQNSSGPNVLDTVIDVEMYLPGKQG